MQELKYYRNEKVRKHVALRDLHHWSKGEFGTGTITRGKSTSVLE